MRQRWGPFPTCPELLEAWPGFIPVTNAFADATDGPPSTELLPAEESAPEMLAENLPEEKEPPPPPTKGWFWRAEPEVEEASEREQELAFEPEPEA